MRWVKLRSSDSRPREEGDVVEFEDQKYVDAPVDIFVPVDFITQVKESRWYDRDVLYDKCNAYVTVGLFESRRLHVFDTVDEVLEKIKNAKEHPSEL